MRWTWRDVRLLLGFLVYAITVVPPAWLKIYRAGRREYISRRAAFRWASTSLDDAFCEDVDRYIEDELSYRFRLYMHFAFGDDGEETVDVGR